MSENRSGDQAGALQADFATSIGRQGLSRSVETRMEARQQLTPEECARITELQEFLSELTVERKEAIETGEEDCARQLQEEIDHFLREKEGIQRSGQRPLDPVAVQHSAITDRARG